MRSRTISDFCEVTAARFPIYAFTIEECILSAHENANLQCPVHQKLSLSLFAPDTVFLDIKNDFFIPPESVKRNKLIGRGAFGFVFKATICQKVLTFIRCLSIYFFNLITSSSAIVRHVF